MRSFAAGMNGISMPLLIGCGFAAKQAYDFAKLGNQV